MLQFLHNKIINMQNYCIFEATDCWFYWDRTCCPWGRAGQQWAVGARTVDHVLPLLLLRLQLGEDLPRDDGVEWRQLHLRFEVGVVVVIRPLVRRRVRRARLGPEAARTVKAPATATTATWSAATRNVSGDNNTNNQSGEKLRNIWLHSNYWDTYRKSVRITNFNN